MPDDSIIEGNPQEIQQRAEEETQSKRQEFTRSFLKILFTVLKFLSVLLSLAVYVIVISVITVRVLNRQNQITSFNEPVSFNSQSTVPAELDWFTQMGEIRGSTKDKEQNTFIIDLYIGYEPNDQTSLQELIRRRVQMKERVTLYFSDQYADEMEGPENIIKMKNELRELINRIMRNKIKEVAFNNFQVIKF